MIKTFLPTVNNFHSGYSQIRNAKLLFENEVRFLKKSPRQSLCVTAFQIQLRDIVQQNLNEIIDYAEMRKLCPHDDFNLEICPPVELNIERNLFFKLIFFSDGVSIKKSTLK